MQESANHTELTEQVQRLEAESRQLLTALKWSTRVRNMLLIAIVAFAAGTGAMFYSLFEEIKNDRLAETQQLFIERQDEFVQPLTKAAYDVAESTGPVVFEAFRNQFAKDSSRYLAVMDQERDAMAQSLKGHLEQRVSELHVQFLQENEALLAEQFPELKDPQSREIFHRNLEATFAEIGRRYYVKYFDAEYERLVNSIDRFPAIRPENPDTSVAKQLAAETTKLFQMLAANVNGSPLNDNAYVMAGLLAENRKPERAPGDLPVEPGSVVDNPNPTSGKPEASTNLADSEEDK